MASPITKINPRGINTTGDYVVNSLSSTGNVAAGNIKTDHLLYANGTPYTFTSSAAGTNTQVQFNDGNNFAGSANLTFDKVTGVLTANFLTGDGSNVSNVNALTLGGHSASYFATSTQGSKADTALQPSALNGYATETYVANAIANIPGANFTGYATESYVGNAVANLVNSAPSVLDTLGELANALGNDANYSTTITSALANKLSTGDFMSTADTWLATKSTTNVAEGTNLYYTDARANTAIDNRVTKTFVDNLSVVANIANVAYSVSGANVSGAVQYAAIANSVSGSNVVGQVGNALIAGTVYTNAQPNITSVGTLTGLTVSGLLTATNTGVKAANIIDTSGTVAINTKYGNVPGAVGITTDLTVGTSGTGNVTATYFIGDGSQLTGLPAGYNDTNANAAIDARVTKIFVDNLGVNAATLGGHSANYFVASTALSTVAISGNYENLNNLPTLFNGEYSSLANRPTLFSGWYTDLSGAPVLANVATSGSYTDLTNTPTLGTAAATNANAYATAAQGSKADTAIQSGANISLFTNDSGYLVSSNLTTYATKTYVDNGIANLVASAPAALDTLNELANALGNDANYSTTITNALANKLSTSSFASIANTWISTQTTSNLTEGTNLYYTVTRANTAIDARVTKLFIDTLGVTANIANIAYSVSGSNVSGAVAYATTANSVAGANVSGQVSNAQVAGTIYTNAQPNITSVGTLTSLTVTGNVISGNVSGGNLVSANYISGNGSLLSAIAGANVTGVVGNASYATVSDSANSVAVANVVGIGNISTINKDGNASNILYGNGIFAAIPASTYGNSNVTSLLSSFGSNTITTTGAISVGSINGSSLSLTGTAALPSIANLYIPGGSVNNVIKTDGNGNLSWTSLSLGNANINGSNTQLFFNDAGNTSLGASADLTFNKTTNTLTTTNLVVNGTTNLGAVGNVTLTGGSSNNFLRTDGSGTLSWTSLPSTTVTLDSFSGNGVQVNFTLSATPASRDYTIVVVSGVFQLKGTYTVSGTTLTFSEAPPNGSSVEVTTINSGVSMPSGGGSGGGFTYQGISANATLTASTKYIVNTSASNITLTLPSTATLGDEIGIIDGTGTASTHALTVYANGGNIMGSSGNLVITTNRAAFSLVYYNAAQGWLMTQV